MIGVVLLKKRKFGLGPERVINWRRLLISRADTNLWQSFRVPRGNDPNLEQRVLPDRHIRMLSSAANNARSTDSPLGVATRRGTTWPVLGRGIKAAEEGKKRLPLRYPYFVVALGYGVVVKALAAANGECE
jgi:hypothetical protein